MAVSTTESATDSRAGVIGEVGINGGPVTTNAQEGAGVRARASRLTELRSGSRSRRRDRYVAFDRLSMEAEILKSSRTALAAKLPRLGMRSHPAVPRRRLQHGAPDLRGYWRQFHP